MKKMLFSFVVSILACATFVQAQTEKGTIMLSLHNFSPAVPEAGYLLAPSNALGITFGTAKSEFGSTKSEYSYTTIGLSGSAHYFLIDNFSAGLNLNMLYQHSKEKGSGSGNTSISSTLLMAGPEVRYYFPAGAKSKIWVGGNGAWGSSKTKIQGEDSNDPAKFSRYSAGAGVSFFPLDHLSIDVGAGYGVFTVNDDYEDFNGIIIKNKDTNSGLSLDFGFSVFF
ncbi:MAG TPA: outer membrane beta-barrel protein [Saprospiraceae bacterium]|nr:outer membrane beta-barrel protein [Saprospiraceae bacterium]HPI05333.1 outer membrane beta-barrel protein [Saprospiraceae bacterium]